MAITEPVPFPSKTPARIQLGMRSVVALVESVFSLAAQTQKHQGQAWLATVTWPILDRADGEEVAAFLGKLNGVQRRFTMGLPADLATARGSASSAPGTPVVDGASQTGGVLAIRGAPAGVTGYLLKGDYFQLGTGLTTRLYKVLNDVDTDSAGDASIDIWPDLRISPGDGDTIVVSNPQGLWRLTSNLNTWDIDEAIHYETAVVMKEAL